MRRVRIPLVALLILAATGCSGGIVPVSGVVTLDGKPVEGASVNFTPEKPESAGAGGAYGKTDSQGRYSLKTVIGDKPGTVAGKYKVTISLSRATPNNPDGPEKELIPTKYNAKSDLTFDVPPGGTDQADFTLTK